VTISLDAVDLADHDRFVDGIPHDMFATLRRDAPVYRHPQRRGPGFWCVTRHDDVAAANRDHTRLSVERGIMLFDQPELEPPDAPRMMIEMDPPRHTRYRLLVNKGFTPRMIGRLEERMRTVTRRTVDRVIDRGECDFVRDLASELPLQTIAEMMSMPEADRADVFRITNRIVGHTDREMSGDGPAYDAIASLHAYANRLAAGRRAELEAGDAPTDILGTLLTAEVDGDRLSEAEFDLFFLLLVVGGSETTRTAISQGMLAFLEHPEQWARLQADHSLMPTAVEEVLRWSTPFLHFRRTATEDFELRGQSIRAGEKVVLWFVSANFDEDEFEAPHRFDVGREPNQHVTFGGGGPHFCLGAHLARLEIRIVLEELLDRIPHLELAGPVERMRSNWTNGLKRMPVRWEAD
jgi:cholest-4-en-3-one 26-monooxygenase